MNSHEYPLTKYELFSYILDNCFNTFDFFVTKQAGRVPQHD